MELCIKIVITLLFVILVWFQVLFVGKIWKSHIDPMATINKIIKKISPSDDLIAVREENKIYQNGKVVGEVDGKIEIIDGKLGFKELFNVEGLNKDMPFEYQRYKLRIINVAMISGVVSKVSANGTNVRNNVWNKVTCTILNSK